MNKRIIVMSICISFLFSSIGFTETSTMITPQNNTVNSAVQYKWEKMAEMAITRNVDFQTTEVDKMKLNRQADDLLNNVNTLENLGYLTFVDKKDKTDPLIDNITLLKNNGKILEENVALKKEILRDTIKNLYITIYKYEIQLNSLQEQIKLNNRLLEVDRKKLILGQISKYELEKNYNGYLKIERQSKSLNTSIGKLYTSLKDLSGIDSKSNIVLDYSFIGSEVIIPLDYESGLKRMNEKNMKIEMYINNASRTKNFKTDIKNRYPVGDISFDTAEMDYSKAQLTLDNALSGLPYKYDSAFSAVMDAYENYIQKQKEYEIKALEMKNTNLKLKLGSSSALEVLMMQTQMKAVENDLVGARIDYVSARVALESTIKGTN